MGRSLKKASSPTPGTFLVPQKTFGCLIASNCKNDSSEGYPPQEGSIP